MNLDSICRPKPKTRLLNRGCRSVLLSFGSVSAVCDIRPSTISIPNIDPAFAYEGDILRGAKRHSTQLRLIPIYKLAKFDFAIPFIIHTIHYQRGCFDCAIKIASRKASLVFDSNYQVFQYPLQYTSISSQGVCAVILDPLRYSLLSLSFLYLMYLV